jgi:hypothetical protein
VFDSRDDPLDHMIRRLRQPVRLDPGLDARIMDRIARAGPARPGSLAAIWQWLIRPRTVRLSPLTALGAAAAVAALVVLARTPRPGPVAERSTHTQRIEFALVARQASSVALVGDFNDWDPTRTPLAPAGVRGVWAAVVPLAPGRHRYAFLVDGAIWVTDPAAPSVPDDEFGTPSSVLTVGGS